MKLFLYIGLIVFFVSCRQSKNESGIHIEEWNTDKSTIDLQEKSIKYDSTNDQSLTIEFTWSPKERNTKKSIFDSTYSIDYLYKRTTILSIHDVSKISLNVNYSLPSNNIKVDCIFLGLYSNFESYKNLKGKIRFEELTDLNTRFKILLTGELNEMIEFKEDTILNEKIRINQ